MPLRSTRRIVARAEHVYVDPSALLKLYVHEPESAAMNAWRARTSGTLPVTLHGWLEVSNGISLAAFRGFIDDDAASDALASFDEDLREERCAIADVPWRRALRTAGALARTHTRRLGCRSLDVLHVAVAAELGMRQFVTFDRRQASLARAHGLKVVAPR